MSISKTYNQRAGMVARLEDEIAIQVATIRKVDFEEGSQGILAAQSRLIRLERMLKALRQIA